MKETEITVQVFNDFDEIDKILRDSGFERFENFTLDDYYFSKFQEVQNLDFLQLLNSSILLRKEKSNAESISLISKQKTLDESGNVLGEEKIKTKVSSFEDTIKILKFAGLNLYCNVKNNSFVYKNEKMEFVVQVVENLGIFIEYEEDETMGGLTEKEKFELMKKNINTLKLSFGEDYSCKKVYMLLHKK